MLSKHRIFKATSLTLLVCLLLSLMVPAVLADTPTNSQGFRKHVTPQGIGEHLDALQAIADENGGTRAASLPGFNESVDYVVERMTDAGYDVSVQEFPFEFTDDATPPTFEQISPNPTTYTNGVDFDTMAYSGSGEVTAGLYAVDFNNALGGLGSGCEASDFAGFTAGSIALMQRGGCTFRIKATNAEAAGAPAVIVVNNVPGLLNGTLGAGGQMAIPVLGTTQALGPSLTNGVVNGPTGVTVHIFADVLAEVRTAYNVIAETPGGDPSRVVVVGAHLDSVTRGPGINDNGSGSATILEIAEVYAEQEREPRNKLRFMWFGAEEFGLLGSNYYVNNLTPAERDNILLMLNFDMIASPNYVRFVYDGDGSHSTPAGPAGSGFIEAVFNEYFASQGLASAPTAFSGRSDYGRFIFYGIPAGGLFTGAEGVKTADQAAVYGGTAGVAYDVCYHLGCDTIDNINWQGLDEMSDAVAHTVLYFSQFKGDLPVTSGAVAPLDAEPADEGPHPDHADHDAVEE